MLLWVCGFLFLLHNITVFMYLSKVFLKSDIHKYRYVLSVIFNVLLFLCFAYEPAHDSLFMIGYILFFSLEIKYIYKDNWIKTFFGGVCFSMNFFGIKLIYLSLYSLYSNITITEVMQDNTACQLILTATLLTNILYTLLFRMLFPKNYLDAILSDKNNLNFVNAIIGVIYLYMIINTRNLYMKEPFDLLPYFELKIAVCLLMGFSAAFLYAYLFARLKLYSIRLKKIEKELELDEKAVQQLEKEVFHDNLTGVFTRDFIENKIDKLLEEKAVFSLIFIDMDGLKLTNDTYGHDEGDFYIKSTAEVLKMEFVQKIIARIGGDEFLILLEQVDSYAAMKFAIRSYDRVKNISKVYHKPYRTSISYGIIEVSLDNTLTRDELIKLADDRMYHFKKTKHKNRSVRKY